MTAGALPARPEVLAALGGLGVGYAFGWWRLRRRAPAAAPAWRALAAGVALGAVALALAPPLDRAAHARFAGHMVQHLLLVTVAGPVWLLADPCPPLLWSAPRRLRRALGALVAPGTPGRRLLRAMTALPPAWLLSGAVLWAWHVPAAYEAALARGWLHDLQHLSLTAAAMLFWWPVIRPAPRVRPAAPGAFRVVYLLLGALANAGLGLAFVLLPRALYAPYARSLTPEQALEDQVLGGLLMWGWSGAVDMLALLLLVRHVLAEPGRRAATLRAELPRP